MKLFRRRSRVSRRVLRAPCRCAPRGPAPKSYRKAARIRCVFLANKQLTSSLLHFSLGLRRGQAKRARIFSR
eukprot:7365251-Prymnesium_polylepis.1